MAKKSPYRPPVSNIRMGRPPIRADESLLEESIAVRLRPEEDEYIKTFCSLIERPLRQRTAIMRELLDLGMGIFDEEEVGRLSVQTCAKGKRYVFRVAEPLNKEVHKKARRISSDQGSRVFMIDVATRIVLMAAQHTLEGLLERGKIASLPPSPLGLEDPREFNFKAKDPKVEGDKTSAA